VTNREQPAADSPEPRRTQWDYRSNVMSVKADLSQYGSEGWELVAVVLLQDNPGLAVYHFKRRRP
jgi:hypothetical protein